ncbi:2632_t:CDS:2 [Ambispora gerdemannii]|uniref:2632_t:CDS:1 n=1 Tax=Ambispora gerdemannii TaxID=144530 RepID=A0A9N8VVF5_9GLOM|nr:2632_t:CDS:2 [Ambispora gerdemannii]
MSTFEHIICLYVCGSVALGPELSWPLLASRYRVLRVIGRGTFSRTLCAEDTYFPGRPLVAIKMMATKFNSIGIQECKILRYLNASDVNNSIPVVKIFNTFVFEQHFCLVFEYLEGGMLTTVPRNQSEHTRLHVIRKFACQILSALMYLQKMGILHADLKPDNILLDSGNSSALKIIDFGNAMNLDDVPIYFKTFEIQNPLYRAPEVLLGIPFGSAIDMWSLEDILLETTTAEGQEDPLLEARSVSI